MLKLRFNKSPGPANAFFPPVQILLDVCPRHRIGQQNEVFVYNFVTEDSIEEYILKILYEKIELFELTIGDLELILGDEVENIERKIFKHYMDTSQSPDFENKLSIMRDHIVKQKTLAQDILNFDKRVFENFDLSPLEKGN